MIEYLKESLCNGLPPANASSNGLFERNALVSRMMLAQGRIKLLCAPSMMGKTSLASQYAKSSRSYCDVFWVDAQHPRFLRGLYDGELHEAVVEAMPERGLFVFEDVPKLGEAERRLFCEACHSIISSGVDVVVSCTPLANPFAEDGDRCVALTSEDLMYSDDELVSLRRQGYLPIGFQGVMSKAERIPGLLGRPSGSIEGFLVAQQAEAEDAFQRLLTYALLVLAGGTMADLSYVMGADVEADDLRVGALRPYVTVSDFGEGFTVEGFPLGDVLRVLKKQLPRICSNGSCIRSEDFACRLANLLVGRRALDRATRVMIEACSPEARLMWLRANVGPMVESCTPLNALLLLRSLPAQLLKEDRLMGFWEAVAHLLIGDSRVAFRRFEAVAGDPDVGMKRRLEAATFAALSCSHHPSTLDFGGSFGDACLQLRKRGEEGPLLKLWNALLEGDSGIDQLLETPVSIEQAKEWLLALACCLRGMRLHEDDAGVSSRESRQLGKLFAKAGEVIGECVTGDAPEARLFLVDKELDSFGYGPQLSRASISFFDQVGARVRVQRSAFAKLSPGSVSEGVGISRFGQDLLRFKSAGSSVMSVPLLEVRVFGRFEAFIGGKPVGKENLCRTKVRSLLALLALEPGKEHSCDRLAMVLWPDSPEEKARRNFYSIFSILKRSLTLEDGTCPYVSRTQGVCRLSAPYVRSDAAELLEICQRMRHRDLAGDDASVLLERLRGVYRGEMLPGERVVYAVEAARKAWRSRVVDALSAAAVRLRDTGDYSIALEFAGFAFECDPQREDACELVMLLQHSMKQRAGAIDTFFTYQKINRELGLDPSHRMLELYDRIISDDVAASSECVLG